MIFNWENIEIYDTPFKYGICDNFLEEYSDDLFPDDAWCKNNLFPLYKKNIFNINK